MIALAECDWQTAGAFRGPTLGTALDIPALARIQAAAMEDADYPDYAWSPHAWRLILARREGLSVWRDLNDVPVGFFFLARSGTFGEVITAVVDPRWKGLGLEELLTQGILSWFQLHNVTRIFAESTYVTAEQLADSLARGFTPAGLSLLFGWMPHRPSPREAAEPRSSPWHLADVCTELAARLTPGLSLALDFDALQRLDGAGLTVADVNGRPEAFALWRMSPDPTGTTLDLRVQAFAATTAESFARVLRGLQAAVPAGELAPTVRLRAWDDAPPWAFKQLDALDFEALRYDARAVYMGSKASLSQAGTQPPGVCWFGLAL